MSWASIHRDVVDGRPVHVKSTGYDARLEAEGLAALAEAGVPVPEVLAVDEHRLVVATVGGPPSWGLLGAALAGAHRSTSRMFGWHRDNVIGSLPQDNRPGPHWPTFYIERRIRPWLAALPTTVRRRLEDACDGPMADLLDHGVAPSLVHGDLWAGNVVDGAWLIDPAVHFADRELDLAFARVFGGIPDEFFDGYAAAWPLDEGWERRVPALQLYHLLVHVELFGRSYLPMVEARLEKLRA
ncbi:MAG: fructosamine kinase family protein [Acidimicrobiia bacterium]